VVEERKGNAVVVVVEEFEDLFVFENSINAFGLAGSRISRIDW